MTLYKEADGDLGEVPTFNEHVSQTKYNVIFVLTRAVVTYPGDRVVKWLGEENEVMRNDLIKEEPSDKASYIVRAFLSFTFMIQKAMQVILFRGMVHYSENV